MTPSGAPFAIVTRDEVWSLGPGRNLLEQRLIHGMAEQRGSVIAATDSRDDELLMRCDEAISIARDAIEPMLEGRARLIVSSRRAGQTIRVETWLNVSVAGLSIVSPPDRVAADYERLIELASARPETSVAYRGIPIVWRNGSAAVLMHEAAGHPAEHRHHTLRWPTWLSVRDDPPFSVDDAGQAARSVDLLAGHSPQSMLRESFTDIPLPRMSNIVVKQDGTEMQHAERYIEVHLVAGGSYDPLTETVTVSVAAADLIDGDRGMRLRPFTIVESRQSVAAATRGATGEAVHYPGVVCSREGQEIVVASAAPAMLTLF